MSCFLRARLAAVTGPDGRIYALGGYRGNRSTKSPPLATVEAYSPATNTWQTLASMAKPRESFGAVVGVDGRIYVIGGLTGSGVAYPSRVALASVEAYTPATNTWQTLSPMSAPRARLVAAAGPDVEMSAIGGQVSAYDLHELGLVEGYTP